MPSAAPPLRVRRRSRRPAAAAARALSGGASEPVADGLALTTDTLYTLGVGRGHKLPEPALPVRGANWDCEQTRASLRRLAALEPSVAWPGHADPVRGDVRARPERAAAA